MADAGVGEAAAANAAKGAGEAAAATEAGALTGSGTGAIGAGAALPGGITVAAPVAGAVEEAASLTGSGGAGGAGVEGAPAAAVPGVTGFVPGPTEEAAALTGSGGAGGAGPIPAGPGATVAAPAPPAAAGGTTPTATNLPVGGSPTGGDVVPGPANPAAAPTPADAVKTPSSGISKALQSIGVTGKDGGLGQNALPIAALTAGQVNANQKNKSAQAQLNKVAQPALSASEQLLAEGTSGTVPPAVMQQFDQSLREKTDEIVQRYANMGRDAKTDSAAQSEIQKAKDARDAQIANYSSTLTTQGLQAAGVAQGPQTAAIQAGVQSDQQLQQAMAGSLQNMALLAALQRGQTPASATP